LGIGDWGLGIGDCAQSPIPNPQSPLIYLFNVTINIFKYIKTLYLKIINKIYIKDKNITTYKNILILYRIKEEFNIGNFKKFQKI